MKKQILVGLVIAGSLQAAQWTSPGGTMVGAGSIQQQVAAAQDAVRAAAMAAAMEDAKSDMKGLAKSMARAVKDLKAAKSKDEVENVKAKLRGMKAQLEAHKMSFMKDRAVKPSRPDLTIGGMAGIWRARIDGILAEASKKKRKMSHVPALGDIMSRMREDMFGLGGFLAPASAEVDTPQAALKRAKRNMKELGDSIARAVKELKAAQSKEAVENIKAKLRAMKERVEAHKMSPHKDKPVKLSKPDLTVGGMAGRWGADLDKVIEEASKKKKKMDYVPALGNVMSRMNVDMAAMQE